MSTIIGLKELRENTEAVAERVAKGESFVVVKRSKAIFEVRPVEVDPLTRQKDVEAWTDEFIERYRPALEALAEK